MNSDGALNKSKQTCISAICLQQIYCKLKKLLSLTDWSAFLDWRCEE